MQYKLASQIDPKNTELRRALGLSLRDQGDIDGAIAELLYVTRQNPHDDEILLALNELMQKRKKQN